MATVIASWAGGDPVLRPAGAAGGEGVGPLPTALLLMEWAAARGADALLAELGGEGVTLVAAEAGSGAAARNARLLPPGAAVLLARLAQPTTVADLLRLGGGAREETLHDLARLSAAGLVRPAAAVAAAEPLAATVGQRVAPDVLRRYVERVARDLHDHPLALDPAAHRSRLADLEPRAAGMGAYELLGVGLGASDEEIHLGFQRLARLVHPGHAAPLRLPAGERALWLLFERATDAYLTLSQPERRRRYNEGLPRLPEGGGAAERPEEARRLARSYYERAQALIDAEDFHFAVELLKQAVHTHPRPEYYVLLGQVQARNPNWLRHARDSYWRAVEMGAAEPAVSVALGRICEELDEPEEARRHYEGVLARDPADPEARAGLARLPPATPPPRRLGFFGGRS